MRNHHHKIIFFVLVLSSSLADHHVYHHSWTPGPNSADNYCVTSQDGHASSCVFRQVCVEDDKFIFRSDVDPSFPRTYSYSRHALEHIQNVEQYLIKMEARKVAHVTYGVEKGVFLPVTFYYLQNTGHVLGDDIFAVFQALTTFGLHRYSQISLLYRGGDVGKRVHDLLSLFQINLIPLTDFNGKCMEVFVAGLSRLTFTLPVRHGAGGVILDTFSEWLASRARVVRTSMSKTSLAITIIKKDFNTALHPMGMVNGDEVGGWVQQLYPKAHVNVVEVPKLSQRELLQLVTDTDILIASPGSDLMTAIHLQPGSAVIVVCYCKLQLTDGTCQVTLGLEVHQWYKERGSVYISPYCNITGSEVTDVGHNPWEGWGGQPWHQIHVSQQKLAPILADAAKFVHNWRSTASSFIK
jgi:hypothetical protein